MSFIDYNKFVADYGNLCSAADITPRQALCLVAALNEHRTPMRGGKVYLPMQLPDTTVIFSDDPDLRDLITDEKPYLMWGDYEKHFFIITEAGIMFLTSHPEIFDVLIPDAFHNA